jgi:hypothetical protein
LSHSINKGSKLQLLPTKKTRKELLQFEHLSSMSRSREPVASLMLYYAFKWSVVSPVLHAYLQGRIYGAENVPQDGLWW